MLSKSLLKDIFKHSLSYRNIFLDGGSFDGNSNNLVGSLYANRIFMYFCIKSRIGTEGEVS